MTKWTDEQVLAINKDKTNIIVSAGAGSGKTAVLTARVIRKLKDGVDINKLLVLTFTNEAAGEMKQRIRDAIKDEESLKEQLDFIDSSYITTFDSFALSILKKYHYALGMSKNISIVDGSIIEIKKREVLEDIFENLYTQQDASFLKLISDFCVKDDKDIKEKVLSISNSLDLKLNKRDYLDSYIQNYYNDDYINDLLTRYVSKIISIKDEIKDIYNDVLREEDESVRNSYTECMGNLINSTSYIEIKKSLNITLPRKVELKEEKKEIKDLIDSLKVLTIYDSEEEIVKIYKSSKVYVEAIIDIIKKLDLAIMEYKRSTNSYEFIDISKMAIEIVKNNNEICNEVKSFYNEIMVDEYQDTNDLQEEFISYIANNNVYMVGDIKQSIYRFRNANPLIFKNKYDAYSNNNSGFKIDLTSNFRSREEVVVNINSIFDKIMNNFLGGAEYKESHRMAFGNKVYKEQNDENISNFLEFYNYDPKTSKFSNEEIEAFIIAKDIKDKINSGYMVLDKKTQKLRKATFSDFCIIMDRGTDFDLYKSVFEYENIPLSIYRDEKLTTSYDILIVKNIIKLVIKIRRKEYDQEFRYLFTSLARSYLFEYSDKTIFSVFKNNSFYTTEIFKVASFIANMMDELSLTEFISMILDRFSFYEKIVKTHGINPIIIRTLYLKRIAKSLELLGYTPYDLGDYLEEMVNSNFDIKYKLNNRVEGNVRIMNIHKSKGLEFPICYYSGLYKKFNISEFNDRFMYDDTYGIITPYYKEGIGTMPTKVLAKDIYIKEEISEQIRLLYVAVTRAKEKMIFVGPLNSNIYNNEELVNDKTRLKYRSFLDIANTIKDDFDGYIKNIEDLSFLTKDYQKFKEMDIDIEKADSISIKNLDIEYNCITDNKFSKVNNKLLTKEELKVIDKGMEVHYAFELTDFKNPNYDIKYGEYIKRFLKNDLLKNIKNARIYKEYEFMYKEGNDSYHGIIDLMLVYQDHIDIIDYKLANIDDPNYIKQLSGYKKYIENKSGLMVNTYLYSIEKDQFKNI